MKKLVEHGARAVTITGGGEPLLHPQFPEIVDTLRNHELELGLVTNGIAMRSWPREVYDRFSWIRVSFDSERETLPDLYRGVPVAFSYVYVPGSDRSKPFISLVKQAEKGIITHLRIVSDIRSADDPSYRFLRSDVSTNPRVIIQNRDRYTKGTEKCWIALVKPVIDVDGLMYPCCGTQYAIKQAPAEYVTDLCMGSVSKYLLRYVIPQKPFDGSRCDVCYYNGYNDVLGAFKALPDVTHREFI
jgi:MoaA/NifB/PqqE/SkfB family radical SAM enzyme